MQTCADLALRGFGTSSAALKKRVLSPFPDGECALLITKGFTAPETREAAERARVLAEKGGNLSPARSTGYSVRQRLKTYRQLYALGCRIERIQHAIEKLTTPRG